MNSAYRSRFGWPFILAVRNATKRTIFASFKARVAMQPSSERDECLRQVRALSDARET
jgi:2-oxo-4-hydroxy-4-carboxy--5-ureidoimidazoline (OHCU) decarboxylase